MVLNTSANVTLDANGRAQIALGPTVYGVTWTVTHIAINSDSIDKPTFKMYKNVESPTTYIDGSRTGNQDTSETNLVLLNLDKLLCIWENGTPDANAAVFIQGIQDGI